MAPAARSRPRVRLFGRLQSERVRRETVIEGRRRVRLTSPAGRFLATYFWEFKLTRPGKLLVVSGLLGTLFFGAVSQLVPVYFVILGLFFLGLFSAVANLMARPRLRMSSTLPYRTSAGEAAQGEVTIRNAGLLPAFDVAVRFFRLPRELVQKEGPHVPTLPRGKEVVLPLRLDTKCRGLYELPPLRAFTTFPFNLLRAGASKTALPPLLVLPRFHPAVSIDVPVSRRYQPGGVSLSSDVGESPEFIGNREFRAGDSIRRLDPRAWARLAKPIVREYQEEYLCRLGLVLDTHIPRRRRRRAEGFPELEAAVSLAATVSDALARGEYVIDIFAAGPELYTFRTGRSTAHFDNVLEILACIDACRTNPFETLTPVLADELHSISTLVCIFLDWDEARRDLMRIASDSGCRTKVLLVRDGEPSLPLDPGEVDTFTVLPPSAIQAGAVEDL